MVVRYTIGFMTEIERILDTYSLEEIFQLNGLTEEDVLTFLVEQNFVSLPDPRPVDVS